jgi:hypothetical protein
LKASQQPVEQTTYLCASERSRRKSRFCNVSKVFCKFKLRFRLVERTTCLPQKDCKAFRRSSSTACWQTMRSRKWRVFICRWNAIPDGCTRVPKYHYLLTALSTGRTLTDRLLAACPSYLCLSPSLYTIPTEPANSFCTAYP